MADTDPPSLPHLAGDSRKMDPSPAHAPHYENLPHISCDPSSFLHAIGISLLSYKQDFYRATLCVSAVFAVVLCTVRLSVTLVDCIHTAEDIVTLLVRPVVFDPKRRYPIPRGTPSAGAQNTGEICAFRLKSPFISETLRYRPLVVM